MRTVHRAAQHHSGTQASHTAPSRKSSRRSGEAIVVQRLRDPAHPTIDNQLEPAFPNERERIVKMREDRGRGSRAVARELTFGAPRSVKLERRAHDIERVRFVHLVVAARVG
jgi:hypothetical protein